MQVITIGSGRWRYLCIPLVMGLFPVTVRALPEREIIDKSALSETRSTEQLISDFLVQDLYRNPQERREAGLTHEVSDGVRYSGLIEVSREQGREHYLEGFSSGFKYRPWTDVQLAFEADVADQLMARVIVTAWKSVSSYGETDVAVLEWNADDDDTEVTLGRQYLPFGVYSSHFATSPLLDFSETRGTAVTVKNYYENNIGFAAFIFTSENHHSAHDIDWGAFLAWDDDEETIGFGISYLSDLAASGEDFLEYYDKSSSRVGAVSAYAYLEYEKYDLFFEYVRAIDSFRQIEKEFDKPEAYNIELAYFLHEAVKVAVRYEGSSEFELEPEKRYGLSISWVPDRRLSFSVDYLKETYKKGFAIDDDDDELTRGHLVNLLISYEF